MLNAGHQTFGGSGMRQWSLEHLKVYAICKHCRGRIVGGSATAHLREAHGIKTKNRTELDAHLEMVEVKKHA